MKNNISRQLTNYPKRIYISRTWVNNDIINIGTNYTTRQKIINEDDFFKINYRFKYSMENTDICTYKEKNNIPLYTRVKIIESCIIGEISEFANNKYLVNLSNNDIAGFNNEIKLEQKYFNENELIILDNGLNSPYLVNIDSLINLIKDKII